PRDILEDARRQKEAAETELAGKSAAVRAELAHDRAGLADVLSALPPDTALASFVRYQRTVPSSTGLRTIPSYVAFVARSGSGRMVRWRLGQAASLDAAVKAGREQTAQGTPAFGVAPEAAEADYRTAGAALRRRIWDPISPHLTGASRVFIVPDGALNFVSFA